MNHAPSPRAVPNDGAPRNVLVVEDDASISLGLRINLEAEGYGVLVAPDGVAGLEAIRHEPIDLVILDVMLPEMNGFEVLQTARKEGFVMPIIVLSARNAEMDKVTGLELGAEDYVAKPFSLAELLARVRAALRRVPQPAARKQVVAGPLRIDVEARTISLRGSPLEMTATEFDVLLCLVEARGKVLSREEVFRRVWGPNHHGTPRTVDNFMQQLRAKIEEDPQNPATLVTVRGVGYRFVS